MKVKKTVPFVLAGFITVSVLAGATLSIYASNNDDDEGKTYALTSPAPHKELNTEKEMEITDVNNPNNPYFQPPVKLSDEDIKRGQENVDTIVNPFGTFIKVNKKDSSISDKDTVNNLEDVTADTKQILHYGNYFVKSNS